jgi:hypothetical protein
LVPDAQIHAVHHKSMQTFGYESTGYTVAGVLITPLLAIAQVAEGSALETALRLEDPVLRVKDRLVSALRTKFDLVNVVVVPASPKNDGIDTLTRSFATGLVLDVRTMKWGVDNARAKYSARARLVRLADRAILWNATCEFTADKTKPGPKMEELKANDGMLLKAKLLDAADGCSDQLVNWLDRRAA